MSFLALEFRRSFAVAASETGVYHRVVLSRGPRNLFVHIQSRNKAQHVQSNLIVWSALCTGSSMVKDGLEFGRMDVTRMPTVGALVKSRYYCSMRAIISQL